MKKTLTRSELEAIGKNWLERRNKLLERSQTELLPVPYRMRDWMLARRMNTRITKIMLILGQHNALKGFQSGGFKRIDGIDNLQPGEYVIVHPKFKK